MTNTLSAPVVLEQFYDASEGWEEAEIDLTPYLGHVVFLIWHYQLLSFDLAARPGWLVDDIAIQTENVALGTIQITNTLAQARFVLSGPVSRTGQGLSTIIGDAPPGEYRITFGPVPFYQTPPAQTQSLTASASLVFFGNYTFEDSNHNGMSDPWEQQFFGAVSGTRTRLTDTDGDGFPDYAEFMAGTNPNAPDSKLAVSAPFKLADGTFRLEWPSVAGRIYRVQGSRDAAHWSPVSNWIAATSATTTFAVPGPAVGAANFFRVEVLP